MLLKIERLLLKLHQDSLAFIHYFNLLAAANIERQHSVSAVDGTFLFSSSSSGF